MLRFRHSERKLYLEAACKYNATQMAVLNILEDCLKLNNSKLIQYYIEKERFYTKMVDISIGAFNDCITKPLIFYDAIEAKKYLKIYWVLIKIDHVQQKIAEKWLRDRYRFLYNTDDF